MLCYQKFISRLDTKYPFYLRKHNRNISICKQQVIMATTLTTFDFGDEEDKKKPKQTPISNRVRKQINLLNSLFYDTNILTGRELFETLREKLINPYKVEFKKENEKMYLVIHPDIVANKIEYVEELENIAKIINDSCNISYIRNVLNKIRINKDEKLSSKLVISFQDLYE
jgi:hypothetical protein